MPTDAFQSCFGPSAGQDVLQPVSRETPFRSGPRQFGQSAAAPLYSDIRQSRAMRTKERFQFGRKYIIGGERFSVLNLLVYPTRLPLIQVTKLPFSGKEVQRWRWS